MEGNMMSQIFVDMYENSQGFEASGADCYGSCNCNGDGCYGCNPNCYCYSPSECYTDCPSNSYC